MIVVNIEAESNLAKPPEKCLQEADMAKNKIYLKASLQQRRHLPPFVASVDGLIGV